MHESEKWKWKVKVKSLSCVRLFATPWTAAYQAPPLMGFSRQEYWSGVSLPSPGTFIVSSKLQLSVCNYGEPVARERGHLLRRDKEVGRAIISKTSMNSYWLSPCRERRGVCLLPIGLCCLPGAWELPLLVSGFYLTELPRTEEPGGLQSMGSQRVGHDWATNTHVC